MNRKEFGNLVRSLRKTSINATTFKPFTQEEFAQEIGVSPNTTIRLETGDPGVKIQRDLLRNMADTFRLTTVERGEFFMTAAGLEEHEITAPKQEISLEILNELSGYLKKVQLPAFIHDTFLDIVMVNQIIAYLYNMNINSVSGTPERSFSNVLTFLLSPEFKNQQKMIRNHEAIVQRRILDFRACTLRHRHTVYFDQLFTELCTYPSFENYWGQAIFWEKDQYTDGQHMTLGSCWGELNFVTTHYRAFTAYGYLSLCIFTPITPHTMQVFCNISQQAGMGYYPVAPWPKEEILEEA
jgi:transcriptional regulator with XRE-family HTH domain